MIRQQSIAIVQRSPAVVNVAEGRSRASRFLGEAAADGTHVNFVRHGNYVITEIQKPNGLYPTVTAWRGITPYFIGFLVMIPFFSNRFFGEPVAQLLRVPTFRSRLAPS